MARNPLLLSLAGDPAEPMPTDRAAVYRRVVRQFLTHPHRASTADALHVDDLLRVLGPSPSTSRTPRPAGSTGCRPPASSRLTAAAPLIAL